MNEKDKDKIIYNYRLIFKMRHRFFWTLSYFIILFIGYVFSINTLNLNSLQSLIIYLVLYFFLYNIFSIGILFVFKRKINFFIPILPWFGVYPKTLITFLEYKKYELYLLFLSSLSFAIIMLFIDRSFLVIIYTFVFTLIIYRFIIFIRILLLKKNNVWIKYNRAGISVYQTE